MRRKIDLLILALVLLVGLVALQNAVAIGDWWYARFNDPSTEAVRLAKNAGMSDTGKKLFFRFNPQIVSRAELDAKCTANKLGCAEGQSIYILQYDNDTQYNTAVVTAAHEMLHVAYSRFSQGELDEVHALLEQELQRSDANAIRTKLKGYPESDYLNEAHSFIGTELEHLSPELEQHYEEFFSNRGIVVQAYKSSD